MKRITVTGYVFLLCLGSMTVLSGCSTTSHVEAADGINFSRYKTFSIESDRKSAQVNGDIIDNNIRNAIKVEMEKKGLRENNSNPDMIVNYSMTKEKSKERETVPVYSTPRYSRYSPYPYYQRGYTTRNVTVINRQFSIDIMDTRSNKIIWQGWTNDQPASRSVSSKDVKTDVKAIMKKFDVSKTS